jgi:hypothetical protein
MMSPSIDPQHHDTRTLLRIVGPAMVLVGLVFCIIGFGSFFASFGSFEMPRYFWCAFVGLPLVGVGLAICKFAFLGAVSRYMANEVAPVGKDVVNYMAEGTKGAVREMASAVGQGLRAPGATAEAHGVRCGRCNAENDRDANFCDGCGAPLSKSRCCQGCGESNDPNARFCDRCGQALA